MRSILCAALFLCFCITAVAQTQSILVDADVDQSVDYQLWWSTITPLLSGISVPNEQQAIRIRKDPAGLGQLSADNCTGEITFGGNARGDFKKSDLSSPTYQLLTWGLVVAGFTPCRDIPDVSSQYWLALQEKVQRVHQLAGAASKVSAVDLLSNRKSLAWISGNTQLFLDDSIGRLGLVARGDFRSYDSVLSGVKALTQNQIVPVLDGQVQKVNGVLPSTYFGESRSLSNREMLDGTLFSVSPAAINPATLDPQYFRREGGGRMIPLTGDIRLSVYDAAGQRVGGYDHFTINPPCAASQCVTFFNTPIRPTAWPDGAYRLDGCVLAAGECDPNLSDSSFYLEYGKSTVGKMFIISNGADFASFSQQNLQVVSTTRSTQVDYLPGLLVVFGLETGDEITLTDGRTIRTFTQGTVASVYLYKRRDDPLLRTVINAAGVSGGKLVASSTAILSGVGLSHNDPVVYDAGSEPISRGCAGNEKNNQGLTRVIFSQYGRELEASFTYCSAGQLTVRVPGELVPGTVTTVVVDLNGQRSNAVSVEVNF